MITREDKRIADLAVSYVERNDFKAINSMLSSGQIDIETLINKVWVALGGGKLAALASTFRKRMSKDKLEYVSRLLANINAVTEFNAQIKDVDDLEKLMDQFRGSIIQELGFDYNSNFSDTSEVLKNAILKMKVDIQSIMGFQGVFLNFFEIKVLIPVKAWLQGKKVDEVAAEKILSRLADAVVPGVISALKANVSNVQEIEIYSDEPDKIIEELVVSYIETNDFKAIKNMMSIKQINMDKVLQKSAGVGYNKLIAVASTFYKDLSRDQLRSVFRILGNNIESIQEFKNAIRGCNELESIMSDFKNAIIRDLGNDYNADLGNTTKLLKNSIASMNLDKQDMEKLQGQFLYFMEINVIIPIKAWLQGREQDEVAAEKIASRIADRIVPEVVGQLKQNSLNNDIQPEEVQHIQENITLDDKSLMQGSKKEQLKEKKWDKFLKKLERDDASPEGDGRFI
ncbi:MAG: hypothetical protein ACK5AV_03195 [Alphaproteobacteria bacterium]|nr:hypothetical protein [Candidatus Jidaibacter sp.]